MLQALCMSHPFCVPQFCVLNKYKVYDDEDDDDDNIDVDNINVSYGCFVSCIILVQSGTL